MRFQVTTPSGDGRVAAALGGSAVLGVLALVVLVGGCSAFHIVPAGFRGVKFNTITGVTPFSYGEGIVWKIPVIESVVDIDVRINKAQDAASAASKDLQTVGTTVALNFRPDPGEAHTIYQSIGLAYRERVIDPAIQEAVKAVTAQYTAEELITKREEVKQKIFEGLVTRLKPDHILVQALNITDFQFSPAFNHAIEEKQTAEQLALKARRDLDRIKVEAEQRIAQARAEAEAQRMLAASVTPQIVELKRIEMMQRAIDKWNGTPPTVVGGALPFWDVRRE